MCMQSHVLRLDRLDQSRKVSLLAPSHLHDPLEVLRRPSLHEHFVPLSELFIRQLKQLDNVFRLAERFIDEGHMVLQILAVRVGP